MNNDVPDFATFRRIMEAESVVLCAHKLGQLHIKERDALRNGLRLAADETTLRIELEKWIPLGLPEDYQTMKARLLNLHSQKSDELPEYLKVILNKKDLLDLIILNVQEEGVVGEGESIFTITLCAAGALVENCHTASYNLIVNSASGSGKDFVVTATLALWPKEKCIKRTRISPTVLTYWHNSKKEPEWTWNGKILYLEDISETVLNSDVFKLMQSSGSVATITVNNTAVELEVIGKPVIIVTTAKSSPNAELLRRNSLCQLDESEAQTKAILLRKAIEAKGDKPQCEQLPLSQALVHLKSRRVIVPFAELVVDEFPTLNMLMRTAFNRFIDLIKASAVLHQHQRNCTVKGEVIANGDDYDNAARALSHLTKNGLMLPVTHEQQKLLLAFDNPEEWYTVEYLSSRLPISDRWLRKQLDHLTKLGVLQVDGKVTANSDKKVRHYMKPRITGKLHLKKFSEFNKNCKDTSLPSICQDASTCSIASNGKELKQLNGEFQPVVEERVLPLSERVESYD